MQFPQDHYQHDKQIEWIYFWGRFSNGNFFHHAHFSMDFIGVRSQAIHSSIHNGQAIYHEEKADEFGQLEGYTKFINVREQRWAIGNKQFGLAMFPESKPMIHQASEGRNYYSISHLKGEGTVFPAEKVTFDAWMDHEFSIVKKFSYWDWVGIKLGCGVYIMVYKSSVDSFCTIGAGDKTIYSDFDLGGDFLHIKETGQYLRLKPVEKEMVFTPEFGVPYSEQPFEVMSRGSVIGYGMRERTHKEN